MTAMAGCRTAEDLDRAILPVALLGLDELQKGTNAKGVRNALSALNGPADTQGPYSLEMQYRVRNWGDGVFTLCVSPTLKSDDAHSVREYTRERKTHWKSKAVKHEVSESETVDKELSMFWGRNTIDVVIDVGNGDEGLPELVASALHGGVTLF